MIGSYLTTKDLAEATTLSVSRLKQLRYEGGGPPFIKVGNRICYDPSDVKKWVNKNKVRKNGKRDRRRKELSGGLG